MVKKLNQMYDDFLNTLGTNGWVWAMMLFFCAMILFCAGGCFLLGRFLKP